MTQLLRQINRSGRIKQMEKYNPGKIEKKWQKKWEKAKLYQAVDFSKKTKKYILIEFPYPSGERLHVGHGRSYCALDALARKKRTEGFNVLYPIGWDAFGLPAENYAIKTGINPQVTTAKNIANARRQVKRWGLSFDWDREISTTDPKYYKWTQWIFLKLFEKGLAYQAEVPVNWCPVCKTNLADEEVLADGAHERCGFPTERRMQKQWLLKITKYCQRLLDDLKTVNYLPKIRIQQENWIGKSEGTDIRFEIPDPTDTNKSYGLWTFTTRPDTLFGVTAIVIAPEKVEEGGHRGLARTLAGLAGKKYFEKVEKYIKTSEKKSELERIELTKEKTGEFTGVYAQNPINKEKVPVWVADYVLGWYGHGAVMLVPAHDQRDFEFAKKYDLKIKEVISGGGISKRAYEGEGKLVNSGEFTGQDSPKARINITKWLEGHQVGRFAVAYKLRDWIFSRQHYWGEPIPIVHCQKCGAIPVPEKDLPVELPYVEKYQPTQTGESPLASVKDWVKVACPECGGAARRETDTMPNWAGSNWYFLRYCDPKNDKELAAFKKLKYWMPVDLYNGGMEHTTLHLLYSRFIHKFLYDIGIVPTSEPYARRHSHGIVLGSDSRKMSKSFENVVNPDEIIEKYGADTFRLYEMFMGPFEQMIPWSDEGVQGCYRFLKRVWKLAQEKISRGKTSDWLVRILHKTIMKVGEDLENLRFNTAVAAMMEFTNSWQGDKEGLNKRDLEKFLLILAPFAPHITEELWSQIGGKFSIHNQKWPEYKKELIKKEMVTVVVQVNGKLRDKIIINHQSSIIKSEIEKLAKESERVKKYLEGKKIKKTVFVPGKLINFVV